jgi:hypothetical protein
MGGRIVERADRLGERRDRQHAETRDDGGFAGVRRGQQNAVGPGAPSRSGDRQHATSGVNRAVQRQLAEQHELRHVTPFDDAGGGEDAERDRQVEGAAGLADVRGRQIDGDPVRRKLEAGITDGTPHAIPALAHAGVRQADHREHRQAERNVDFDVHRARLDAEDRRAPQTGEHALAPANIVSNDAIECFQRVAEAVPACVAELATRRRQRTRSDCN